jgi:ABC-type amino acid transport substrate-binding protein
MTINSCTAGFLIAVFLFVFASEANAQATGGTLDKIADSGEFVVGYRADSSPLSYEDADGRPLGYAVEICRRVGATINAYFPDRNIATRFVRITADERISAVVDGKIDIECGSTTITLSRQEEVDFSLPTFVTGGSVLTLAALIGQIMEAADPKRYALAGDIFSFEPYGLVLRRNDAAFRLVVNRAIARLYRSGDHADIYYKWIGRIGIDVPPMLAAMYQLNALPE